MFWKVHIVRTLNKKVSISSVKLLYISNYISISKTIYIDPINQTLYVNFNTGELQNVLFTIYPEMYFFIVILTIIAFIQDERNQIMTSNVWLDMVSWRRIR